MKMNSRHQLPCFHRHIPQSKPRQNCRRQHKNPNQLLRKMKRVQFDKSQSIRPRSLYCYHRMTQDQRLKSFHIPHKIQDLLQHNRNLIRFNIGLSIHQLPIHFHRRMIQEDVVNCFHKQHRWCLLGRSMSWLLFNKTRNIRLMRLSSHHHMTRLEFQLRSFHKMNKMKDFLNIPIPGKLNNLLNSRLEDLNFRHHMSQVLI